MSARRAHQVGQLTRNVRLATSPAHVPAGGIRAGTKASEKQNSSLSPCASIAGTADSTICTEPQA